MDPRSILEEGLRRELVRQIAKAMHETVVFQEMSRFEISAKLSQLAATLDGLKRSIEYLQDYIGIAGLKMYHEEIVRVICYNAEQEANQYLKKKISDASSRYQSRAIPIPSFPSLPPTLSSSSSSSKISALLSVEPNAVNFMGRIVNSIVFLTHSARTVYAPESSTWYQRIKTSEKKSKKNTKEHLVESCGVRTFALLERSLGPVGLRGLDRLFAFRAVSELNSFLKFYETDVSEHKTFLDQVVPIFLKHYFLFLNIFF